MAGPFAFGGVLGQSCAASLPEPIETRMMKPTVRPATAADIPAITAIYRPAVLTGTASFELEPPDEAEMLRRFRGHR